MCPIDVTTKTTPHAHTEDFVGTRSSCIASGSFSFQECEKVLYELENIDDELDDFGITLVTTEDIKYAGRRLKIRKFPALGMFRNGGFLLYEGPLKVGGL